jgi:hypothetical protein
VASLVANGRVLADLPDTDGDGPWALTLADQTLIAVYERFRPGEIKPAVVLPTAHQG